MANPTSLNQGHNPHWLCICGMKNHETRTKCLNCNLLRLPND